MGWWRVLDTVAGLAQMTVARRADTAAPGPLGALETRLAGVVVAALKEAFDRDKARMDLERETIEADRARAERALQAELRRQAAERTLTHLKLIAIFCGSLLLVSGVLTAVVPGMRGGVSRVLLACGWAGALAALGCVFAAWPGVSRWAASDQPETQHSTAAATAPWLLLLALALVGASVLFA